MIMLGCAACGGDVKETLGLNRDAPDEFRVVSRPPLSVPKEFYLYPPNEAGKHAVSHSGTDARAILFEGSRNPSASLESLESGLADSAAPVVRSGALPSQGEEALLGKMGAAKAQTDIRSTLREEAKKPDDTGLLESLQRKAASDPVVDAQKERERLMEAKKQGTSVSDGDVPVISKDESTLDWLFN